MRAEKARNSGGVIAMGSNVSLGSPAFGSQGANEKRDSCHFIMASEERMQSATSTSRLQHTAKLGECGEMLQLTEATIVACEAARGCWSHYYGKRRAHAVCDINESTATTRIAQCVRRDAATDRGHHWGHARSSGRLLEYYGK